MGSIVHCTWSFKLVFRVLHRYLITMLLVVIVINVISQVKFKEIFIIVSLHLEHRKSELNPSCMHVSINVTIKSYQNHIEMRITRTLQLVDKIFINLNLN